MARRPNRRGEGSLLRDEIVRAAGELLEEHGSAEAVTLRAVARKVGIAAPSIYAHFADREAILLAVVQTVFAELTDRLTAEGAGITDPVDRLLAISDAYVRFAFDRPGRYQVLFGSNGGLDALAAEPPAIRGPRPAAAPGAPGAPEEGVVIGADAFGVLVEAIADCARAGRSATRDPWHEAVLVWVALHGYATLACGMPDFPWEDRDGTVRALVPRLALLT